MAKNFSADAKFKMGGRVPTNNATQMAQSINKALTGKGAKNLSEHTKRNMGRAIKTLAKGQESTAKAAIRTAGETAVSLGTTIAGSRAYSRGKEAEAAKASAASTRAYESALNQWNGVINQRVEDPYTEGSSGQVSGFENTGSVLGG